MRRNENPVAEILAVVMSNAACPLKGWVAIARPVNISIKDDVADLILARPAVTTVSVFNVGTRMEFLDRVDHGTLASGHAYGRVDTVIALNTLCSADKKKRLNAMIKLSQLIRPDGIIYFTRLAAGAEWRVEPQVKYFTDDEFKQELSEYFTNITVIPSENKRYPITKCGGLPKL